MEMIVYVAAEFSMAVEPWAGTNKETSSVKPFWTVVTKGRTVIRFSVKVAVGTNWRRPDPDALRVRLAHKSGSSKETG